MNRHEPSRRPIRSIEAEWSDVVLVCRKCSKKLDGGFGPDADQRFGKALKRSLARPKTRGRAAKTWRNAVAVLEVGCLDVCPKGGVVALRPDRSAELFIIPRGTPMAKVIEQLGLDADRLDGREP